MYWDYVTLLKKLYKQQEKNGSTHYFAVCPACDNPIQIMYYWTTLYNIPWMLLYFLSARNCYGMLVKIDSLFYDLLKKQKDVSLVQSSMKDYWCVRNKDNQYLNLSISAIHHKRNIVNDTLEELIKVWFFKNKEDFAPQKLFSITLQINEYRFLNWISSPKAEQYRNGERNQRLLKIAKEVMPDL